MVLLLCEMQSVSSRIWTGVAVSISYDDNHYTTGTTYSPVSSSDFQFLQGYFLKPFSDRSKCIDCKWHLSLSFSLSLSLSLSPIFLVLWQGLSIYLCFHFLLFLFLYYLLELQNPLLLLFLYSMLRVLHLLIQLRSYRFLIWFSWRENRISCFICYETRF